MKQILKLSIISLLVLSAQMSLAKTPIEACIGKINQTLGLDGQTPKVLAGNLTGYTNGFLTCDLMLTTTEEKNSVYLRMDVHDKNQGNKLVSSYNFLLFDPTQDESFVKMSLETCDITQNILVQYSEAQQTAWKTSATNTFTIERNKEGKITSVSARTTGSAYSGKTTSCTFE